VGNSLKKKLIAIVLALIALISGWSYWKAQSQAKAVAYREGKVARGNLAVKVIATGTVQPENRLEIKAPIAGRAEKVLVDEGQKVRKGQTLAWVSSTERAALLDAARARGESEYAKWESYYKPTPVVAPLPGMVILRNIEPGQTFTTSDAILVMSDHLSMKAQVDETDLAKIALGQNAVITLDAYPNNEIEARVTHIAFEAKTVNNVTTYIVDVTPKETPEYMRSGMTANVTFIVDERKNALLVPSEALKTAKQEVSVEVKGGERGAPVKKIIQTGLSDGKRTEVVAGLSEGETILIPVVEAKGDKGKSSSSPFGMPRPPGASGSRRGQGGGQGPGSR
jgi:macrolide-specific efflux system membrane fusion protein